MATRAADYLTTYVRDEEDLGSVSVDLITRVAARIEEMRKRLLPQRKPKTESEKKK